MAEFTHVRSDAELAAYLGRLESRAVREIAFDIEGEFNLHVYGERLCLLQIFDGEEEVVIDPFSTSADALRDLLESERVAKITYDSSSDRLLLAKTKGLRLTSIVDLRPAVDLLEFERRDLGSVIEEALGHGSEGSKKRFQQYNWTRRPIDPRAIEYALRDVRYLIPLRDALFARLEEAGLRGAYEEENDRLQATEPKLNRKPGVFRSNQFKRMSRDEQAAFGRLYDIRDRYARELDLPPNTVVANKALFAIARGSMSPAEIEGNRAVPTETIARIRREMTDR